MQSSLGPAPLPAREAADERDRGVEGLALRGEEEQHDHGDCRKERYAKAIPGVAARFCSSCSASADVAHCALLLRDTAVEPVQLLQLRSDIEEAFETIHAVLRIDRRT